jgi:hypothetical protein
MRLSQVFAYCDF